MSVAGSNAIVDWVFLEVRDGIDNNTVVATKYALVQRDGDVVSCIDGVSPVYLSCVCPGNYYVSIKHRNHLGVMTAATMSLSATTSSYDFSDPMANVWVKPSVSPGDITNAPRHLIGNKSVRSIMGWLMTNNKLLLSLTISIRTIFFIKCIEILI